MNKVLRFRIPASAAFLLCIATAIASPAQTFTKLYIFSCPGYCPQGAYPLALIQATDGEFYGTTEYDAGTVFKVTPRGTLTTLHSFDGTDGYEAVGALVQGTDGDFYGTTRNGGNSGNYGTVFKITAAGRLTTLYRFCAQKGCADGAYPLDGLVQATDGDFYGTTLQGGSFTCYFDGVPYGCGTFFKITPGGTLTTLHSFDGTDGSEPSTLVQATDGSFYGTTYYGGNFACYPDTSDGCGTVFTVTAEGTLTTLHTFDATDGAFPAAGVIQATNGNFYGTTPLGGANDGGTVFEITPRGTLTTWHNFEGGEIPEGRLVQATDGRFYGTTYYGGAFNYGSVFRVTRKGRLKTLHSFDATDGAYPAAGVVQATNGTFYGTTFTGGGGGYGYGTVFSLSVGLGPFVETNPTSGKVGAKVIVLGTNLTGTSSVTFNGTAAKFKVVKSSEITTTVPTGATTGTVSVTTPKKVLKSNVVFRVKK